MLNSINRTERGNLIISTVKPFAMAWYGNYETAISFNNQETWNIAEGYNTREEAEKGHKKYSNMSENELNEIKFL